MEFKPQKAISIETGFNSESRVLRTQKRKISWEWNHLKFSKWFWYFKWFIKENYE